MVSKIYGLPSKWVEMTNYCSHGFTGEFRPGCFFFAVQRVRPKGVSATFLCSEYWKSQIELTSKNKFTSNRGWYRNARVNRWILCIFFSQVPRIITFLSRPTFLIAHFYQNPFTIAQFFVEDATYSYSTNFVRYLAPFVVAWKKHGIFSLFSRDFWSIFPVIITMP